VTTADRLALPFAGPVPPRVTVAVSTWNRAHLVGRAIASVQAQTFKDIEILVVDDGSTDATPHVLGRIDDPRLRIIRLDRNGGISRTRNTAIVLARGEWLAFLDDDNEWAPDYLSRQLTLAASRPGVDVVYCRAWRHDERLGNDGVIPEVIREGRVFRHLLRGWMLLLSSALLRRSTLVAIGGLDEELKASEDRDLWLRLAQRSDFAGTPDVLVVRHHHQGARLSRNYRLIARDAALLDAKWKATVTASCGWVAYRGWRAMLLATTELVRAMQAADEGAVREGLRSVGRMAWHLPWSAPYVARGIALTVLGPRAYRYLVRSRWTLRARVARLGDRARGRRRGARERLDAQRGSVRG
jgi:glycosyltransferase involved in cell wall biosynthesis